MINLSLDWTKQRHRTDVIDSRSKSLSLLPYSKVIINTRWPMLPVTCRGAGRPASTSHRDQADCTVEFTITNSRAMAILTFSQLSQPISQPS